jgi:S-adenosylmethionine hydrolase
VFLLTDYGENDEFAGLTRAVLHRQAPGATVVDLTHGVPPFDVRAGALILARSVGFLGPGVVVAVVDPGVGSGRRAVAVAVRGADGSSADGPGLLVGPDNGLLGWAIDALGGAVAAVALPAVRGARRTGAPAALAGPAGRTFDGRDLFAPVAARLWSGATLNDVGMPVDPAGLVRLAPPILRVSPGSVEAEVLSVDRFGNVQLAARPADAARAGLGGGDGGDGGAGGDEAVEIRVHGHGPAAAAAAATSAATAGSMRRGPMIGSFSDLEGAGEGTVGLMVDANGRLALVCHRRSAATVLGVRSGDMVTLHRVPSQAP